VIDTQVLVDENMKKKWEVAKDEKEKTAVLIETHGKALYDLDRVIIGATDNLAQLVEQYARLALSGSFSAQVASAVRLLEQNYTALDKKGVDQHQLQRVTVSLVHMKRKLELLDNAKGEASTFDIENDNPTIK